MYGLLCCLFCDALGCGLFDIWVCVLGKLWVAWFAFVIYLLLVDVVVVGVYFVSVLVLIMILNCVCILLYCLLPCWLGLCFVCWVICVCVVFVWFCYDWCLDVVFWNFWLLCLVWIRLLIYLWFAYVFVVCCSSYLFVDWFVRCFDLFTVVDCLFLVLLIACWFVCGLLLINLWLLVLLYLVCCEFWRFDVVLLLDCGLLDLFVILNSCTLCTSFKLTFGLHACFVCGWCGSYDDLRFLWLHCLLYCLLCFAWLVFA